MFIVCSTSDILHLTISHVLPPSPSKIKVGRKIESVGLCQANHNTTLQKLARNGRVVGIYAHHNDNYNVWIPQRNSSQSYCQTFVLSLYVHALSVKLETHAYVVIIAAGLI